MKTKGNLFIVVGIVFALIIGFLIGISVDYPKIDNSSVSGTIRKINNYRKAQSSISEIKIQNELASDTTKLKSVQNLLNFYYITAVKMAGDVKFAVDEANAVDAFRTSNQSQITNMTNYEHFLSSARTDLLLAISVCRNPEKTDPLLLKEMLNQANNVIAQINYRNQTVLNFIDVLSSYVEANKTGKFQELMRVHDLLMLNEINSALMTRNKILLNFFDKKALLTDGKNLNWVDQKNMNKLMQQDMEKLSALDVEKLGITDMEKLGAAVEDAEELGRIIVFDAEKLGRLMDTEKLGIEIVFDAEKLGMYNDTEILGLIK